MSLYSKTYPGRSASALSSVPRTKYYKDNLGRRYVFADDDYAKSFIDAMSDISDTVVFECVLPRNRHDMEDPVFFPVDGEILEIVAEVTKKRSPSKMTIEITAVYYTNKRSVATVVGLVRDS